MAKRTICLITIFSLLIIKIYAEDLRTYTFKSLEVYPCECNPKIDGIIDPEEWTAKSFGNFVLTNGKLRQEAIYQTSFNLCYNDEFLFIAVKCIEPEIEGIVATAVMFDDNNLFYDDRIELFLDVNHDHRDYIHLMLNPAGVKYDRKVKHWLPGTRTYHGYPEWNGFWYAATKIYDDKWTAEIAIELASLGIQDKSELLSWGFNIGRVRQPAEKYGDNIRNISPAKGVEYSAWTFVHDAIGETPSNFYEPMQFGDMNFINNKFIIDNISFPNMSYGHGDRGRSSVFGYNPFVIKFSSIELTQILTEVNVYIPSEGGIFRDDIPKIKNWSEQSLKEIKNNSLSLNYFIQHDQEHFIEVILKDPVTEKKLYSTSYMVNVPPFIEFDLETLYTGKKDFNKPLGYRLRLDNIKLSDFSLKLDFMDENKFIFESVRINNPVISSDFKPVFNASKLRELPGGNYLIDCSLYDKTNNKISGHFIQNLTKFSDNSKASFSVKKENYLYGGISGEALVVTFPFNAKFVFWSKASFIPWWEMDQAVMSNEFVETWGFGAEGCAEPMQDRENRYSKVQIIENSPARIKIKWRYALNDAHYYIHANEWVEEFYTFYPDGTGVREINLFANTDKGHELFEAIFVNPPHVSTFQLYEDKITTLNNLNGIQYSIREFSADPDLYSKFIAENKYLLFETHFKDRLHPFTFFAIDDRTIPPSESNRISVSSKLVKEDVKRGHWPASRYQVDGFNTVGNDMPGHFSLGNVHVRTNSELRPNKWLFLIGVNTDNNDLPVLAAKSWITPALPVKINDSFILKGYDLSQRAYVLSYSGKGEKLNINYKDKLYNPAFILENSSFNEIKNIRINGKVPEQNRYLKGKSENNDLILFIQDTFKKGCRIEIEFTK